MKDQKTYGWDQMGVVGFRKKFVELRSAYALALAERIRAEAAVEDIEEQLDELLEDALLLQGYERVNQDTK